MERVKTKVDREYEIFYLDMMRTSKANIFANSEEIEIKKSIYGILKEEKSLNGQEEILCACENLLEEIYRYVDDHLSESLESGKEIHALVMDWVRKKI